MAATPVSRTSTKARHAHYIFTHEGGQTKESLVLEGGQNNHPSQEGHELLGVWSKSDASAVTFVAGDCQPAKMKSQYVNLWE